MRIALERAAAMIAVVVGATAVFGASTAAADSPLTSTPFHEAYTNVAEVAGATQGLDEAVMAALSNPNIPNDVRAAMINALGWSVDGQDHARRYVVHLALRHRVSASRLRAADLLPHELLALGYMVAMDDYRTLRPARVAGELGQMTPHALLDLAQERAPDDATIRLVRALVSAQDMMHQGQPAWCQTYLQVAGATTGARRGLRPDALRIVKDYMQHYQRYCDGQTTSAGGSGVRVRRPGAQGGSGRSPRPVR